MREIWKDTPNFEGYYQAPTLGNILRINSGEGVGKIWEHNP